LFAQISNMILQYHAINREKCENEFLEDICTYLTSKMPNELNKNNHSLSNENKEKIDFFKMDFNKSKNIWKSIQEELETLGYVKTLPIKFQNLLTFIEDYNSIDNGINKIELKIKAYNELPLTEDLLKLKIQEAKNE
ncbi:unnamed protein product, partial [Gordionus sp. m RMFG-2023]